MSDLSISPSDVFAGDGATIDNDHICGCAHVLQGQIVFLDPTSDQYWLATANTSPDVSSNSISQSTPSGDGGSVTLGICLSESYASQPISVLTLGSVSLGSILTNSQTYYLSETTGNTGSSAGLGNAGPVSVGGMIDGTIGDSGGYRTVLGSATSDSVLYFNPSY